MITDFFNVLFGSLQYVGNMHGDEPLGREITMYLAEWLCANYLKDTMASSKEI